MPPSPFGRKVNEIDRMRSDKTNPKGEDGSWKSNTQKQGGKG